MLWVCKEDRVRYSVGAPACPQCGSTDHHEEGDEPVTVPAAASTSGKRRGGGQNAATGQKSGEDKAAGTDADGTA